MIETTRSVLAKALSPAEQKQREDAAKASADKRRGTGKKNQFAGASKKQLQDLRTLHQNSTPEQREALKMMREAADSGKALKILPLQAMAIAERVKGKKGYKFEIKGNTAFLITPSGDRIPFKW